MRLRTTTTLLLALAAGLAAGCGSDDEGSSPIPADTASGLQGQLDSIQSRFQTGGGACGDITGGLDPNQPAVQSAIDSLPQDVDPDVRQALQDGFDRLFTLTGEQCDENQGQETEQEPTPLPEPEPETDTETTPAETETETETTPTLPEEPPIEPTPPEEDSSGDEGNGGAVTPEDEG